MNNQEAFNKVCAHLNQQRRTAVFENEVGGGTKCAYAAPDGTACAIGCLLPRELGLKLDHLRHSGSGWNGVITNNIEPAALEARKLLEGVFDPLLADLQSVHDRLEAYKDDAFWRLAKSELIDLAESYELELPPELQS